MGTAKRERQKANRTRREEEMARDKAKSRTVKLSIVIGGAIVAVFVIVAVAGRFFLDSDDEPAVVNDVDTVVEVEDDVEPDVEPEAPEAPEAPEDEAPAESNAPDESTDEN